MAGLNYDVSFSMGFCHVMLRVVCVRESYIQLHNVLSSIFALYTQLASFLLCAIQSSKAKAKLQCLHVSRAGPVHLPRVYTLITSFISRVTFNSALQFTSGNLKTKALTLTLSVASRTTDLDLMVLSSGI